MAQALLHAVRDTASIQLDQVEKSHRGGLLISALLVR